MYIYDIVNKISKVTRIYRRKVYSPDDIVAIMHTEGGLVKVKFKDYSKDSLIETFSSSQYTRIEVIMDFWDPDFCTYDNLSDKDIAYISEKYNITNTVKRACAGVLCALISIYQMIYKSYTTNSKKDILENIRLDRHIIVAGFKCVDIVVILSPFIIDLLQKISELVI